MATTLTASTFKARFTVWSAVDDSVISSAITRATDWINEPAFGSQGRFDEAVAALTRHFLQWDALVNAAASPAASASAVASGSISSMSGLSASVSFSTMSAFSDDGFAVTEGGRAFLSLSSKVFPTRFLT